MKGEKTVATLFGLLRSLFMGFFNYKNEDCD